MAAGHDAQKVAERVEALLAKLGSQAGPEVAATAEELVSCLVELYGAGLAEIVKIIGEDLDAGRRLMDRLAGDPLVEGLLLLHDFGRRVLHEVRVLQLGLRSLQLLAFLEPGVQCLQLRINQRWHVLRLGRR